MGVGVSSKFKILKKKEMGGGWRGWGRREKLCNWTINSEKNVIIHH